MNQPDLFDFQESGIINIAELFRKGYKKVIAISPGGSGKTVISAAQTQKFHLKQYQKETKKKVAFFTHREELFDQTRDKFLRFGNITEPINANTSNINPNSDTFVVMVETFDRRCISNDFLLNFKDVGLLFIDEAHRTDFNKILHHFDNALIQGWTATPISAKKSIPLNSIWDTCIEIATVSQLQKLNAINPEQGVVPCDCYNLGKVDRDKLKVKGIDFDEKKMSSDFSGSLQVDNVLENYYSYGKGMKGLCFNVDIEHNQTMHDNFVAAGVPSRQLHSDSKKHYGAPKSSLAKNWRKDTVLWLKNTEGAIIHNVGILTTGFDEPSVELVITNYSSLSLPKVVQSHVRGARAYFNTKTKKWKDYYRWLDFGKNCSYFNTDGNNDLPWIYYFNNPNDTKPKEGVSAMKTCPICGNLNSPASRFCSGLKEDWLYSEYKVCGYEFPIVTKEEDLIPREMVKFFVDGISVLDIISIGKKQGWKDGAVFFKILEAVSDMCILRFGLFIEEEHFDFLLNISVNKMKEFGKIVGKRYWKDFIKPALIEALNKKGIIFDVGINLEVEEIPE